MPILHCITLFFFHTFPIILIDIHPFCLSFLLSFHPSFLHCSPYASILPYPPSHLLTQSRITTFSLPSPPNIPSIHPSWFSHITMPTHITFYSFTLPPIPNALHHLHPFHPHCSNSSANRNAKCTRLCIGQCNAIISILTNTNFNAIVSLRAT